MGQIQRYGFAQINGRTVAGSRKQDDGPFVLYADHLAAMATMYSLEQVEKAVRQVWGEQGWASSTGMVVIEGVRARLTARQPTDRLWS